MKMCLHDVVSRYCGLQAIQVPVAQCPSCGAEFRVLPSLVVPYKQHAANTLATALGMRAAGRGWRVVAQSVGVAVSLLKRWQRWWLQGQDVMWSQVQAKLGRSSSLDQWRSESGLVGRLLEFPRWSGPVQCRA
jgi:hypothetical protein